MEARLKGPGLGAILIALSGIGLLGYGVLMLIRNFNGFIELGLTPAMVGGSPEQIAALDPRLYDYISHLQVALAGLLMAFGAAVIALAWFGIRAGHAWALWTAFSAEMIALVVGLPLHFVYGISTLGHLGPVYLAIVLTLAGTLLSYKSVR